MTLAWFRDLVISVAGLVFIGVLILYAVLAYGFYRRVKPVLVMLQGFSACTAGILSVIRGMNMWANMANMFGKKGGKQK